MNILLEYPELENDIEMAFQEIIDNYNFELIRLEEGQYKLDNGSCIINISYDRGDIYCFFTDPKELVNDDKYPVLSVNKYLYPNHDQDNAWYESKEKLKKIAFIINENLQNVLKGDFSWIQEFKQKQIFLRKLIKYVSSDMNRSNIIYRKFQKDDPSWVDDLKIYIRENEIIL